MMVLRLKAAGQAGNHMLLKTGHFHFGRNRTFSLWLDTYYTHLLTIAVIQNMLSRNKNCTIFFETVSILLKKRLLHHMDSAYF